MPAHKDQTGAAAVHQFAYKQSGDPGAVGVGKGWIDTTSGPPYALKVRNATDTGWDAVGSTGGVTDHGALTGLADDDHPQYATDTDLTTHAGAADPHTGYRLESASIGTSDIANDAVTYAKVQNVSATDKILGRDTAAAGDIEELAVSGGLEFTGGPGIQRSALTGDVTASAGSNATTIASGAVTLAKQANLAQDQFIGRVTASTGVPETATITAAARTLLDDTSTGAMLTTIGAIDKTILDAKGDLLGATGDNTPARVGPVGTDGQVLTADAASTAGVKWATPSVGGVSDGDKGDITVSGSGATYTIDNDVVTYAKMQNVSATDKVLGRSTAGAGDVEEIAMTAAGRALVDDADAAAQRTTLGLGTAATHATGDYEATGAVSTHAGLSDPHTGYQKESEKDANSGYVGLGAAQGTRDGTKFLRDDGTWQAASGSGAPTDVDYLVGTASGGLSAEIVVGTAPGGELGGTWASPTVDATHSGSTHAAAQAAAEATAAAAASVHAAAADPHTGYRLESATIGTTDIAADAVTYAKIQNVSATDKILGRDTAAAGDVEELAVSGGLEFTGGPGIQRSALTGDVTATAGSNATTLAAGSASNLNSGTLPAGRMPAHTGDVTSSAGAVALTIANDAVTYAKMQNVSATDKLLGRSTSGSGDVEEIALTSAGRALIDDADAAAQRTTLGINSQWTGVITKGATESVASSIVPQDDDELTVTLTSGKVYLIEFILLWDSPSGGGTPDLRISAGEDATNRGTLQFVRLTAADASSGDTMKCDQTDVLAAGTATTTRAGILRGTYISNGGVFKLKWSQNTSGINATRVLAGSILRYQQIN